MKQNGILAHQLAKIMTSQRVSQKQLAQIACVPISTFHGWLTGSAPTQFESIKRISDHFGMTLAELLTNSHDQINLHHAEGAKDPGIQTALNDLISAVRTSIQKNSK